MHRLDIDLTQHIPFAVQAQMRTQRLDVPFYVKNHYDLDRSYPRGSGARTRLERQVGGGDDAWV